MLLFICKLRKVAGNPTTLCLLFLVLSAPIGIFAQNETQTENLDIDPEPALEVQAPQQVITGPIVPPKAAPASKDEIDRHKLAKLSLRQKVGQLFIFGFNGDRINQGLSQTIAESHPGGIIVFSRNIKTARQISELLYSAQEESLKSTALPLLIAVDQEGGDVIRIKTVPPLPSALALGESGKPELVRAAGRQTGIILKTLGFNMNLAPVLDISDPNQRSFIGTRTYGKDSKIVSEMGSEFAAGLRSAGILPTAKHFPGHGGITEDSHLKTPTKDESMEELLTGDLLPFSKLSTNPNASAIMVAHIAYPNVDPTGRPATFSKILITDILRKRLGFGGIVMTDDIEMGGASSIKDPGERALASLEAGVDLIMLAWNRKQQTKVVNQVYQAVKSGRIAEARVDESVLRILKAKREFANFTTGTKPEPGVYLAALRNGELKKIAAEVLEIRFQSALKQLEKFESADKTKNGSVLVFAPNDQFLKSFRSKFDETRKIKFYSLSSETASSINKAVRANPGSTALLYVVGPSSARMANKLASDVSARTFIVNAESQGRLVHPQDFAVVVDVAFKHPDAGAAAASYLFAKPVPVPVPVTRTREPSNEAEP